MKQAPTIDAIIRGPTLFKGGVKVMADMLVGDPVGLLRQPDNPVDPSAIIVTNMDEQPFGYIQREKSGELAGWMDAGWVYLSKILVAGTFIDMGGGRRGIKADSVIVRCVPLKPISFKKQIVTEVPTHVNCRSVLVKT